MLHHNIAYATNTFTSHIVCFLYVYVQGRHQGYTAHPLKSLIYSGGSYLKPHADRKTQILQ